MKIRKIYTNLSIGHSCILLIRTSSEYRISNYLLWQLAYTELYFTKCCGPILQENLLKAIDDFQRMYSSFGKTNKQTSIKRNKQINLTLIEK